MECFVVKLILSPGAARAKKTWKALLGDLMEIYFCVIPGKAKMNL